ncbi:hypothetical protein NCPPB1935_19360 [Xanthomonas campestris pv. nigromaculans]|nr:hypothetical protein XGA_4070 [Xanthomonas hortorum ATCC 19865]ETC85989.1 hypothetical protein XHC_3808 [Xanthomonas hortorum pv. carotae str. M081]CAD0306546.1 hypothetical protein CFBP2044_07370 [Xanthomonas hortorum pv. cynarae]CAD0306554.1 hypothetical protein CFBP2044_07370 [Xanthomonas hortorum pv. cynarae]CAH2709904.1 hypothetical protein NCPPB1935_19360 [Xanthomonas campestris pv. nigromaculans]
MAIPLQVMDGLRALLLRKSNSRCLLPGPPLIGINQTSGDIWMLPEIGLQRPD